MLGLTGIMSEAELHVLRGRMRQGLLNKVRRGEVFMEPSAGYIRSPEGGFDFDPDEQARAVVRLVFDQFERPGTVRKTLRYLFTNDIRLGIRPHAGPTRGQLEWRLPTRGTVTEMLRCPNYAGYYALLLPLLRIPFIARMADKGARGCADGRCAVPQGRAEGRAVGRARPMRGWPGSLGDPVGRRSH
ncbi:MAG TPA: recombinase family protein [Isosphaeraceae bacterium]|nr:recombinase family protein [Isosphaeraceae bacterium]